MNNKPQQNSVCLPIRSQISFQGFAWCTRLNLYYVQHTLYIHTLSGYKRHVNIVYVIHCLTKLIVIYDCHKYGLIAIAEQLTLVAASDKRIFVVRVDYVSYTWLMFIEQNVAFIAPKIEKKTALNINNFLNCTSILD